MTEVAAYAPRVYISEDNVTYYEVDGVSDIDVQDVMGSVDASSFKDQLGAVQRGTTLADLTASFSGLYATEATGHGTLRKVNQSRAVAYLKVLWNGTNGFKCAGLFKSYSGNAAADAVYKFTGAFEAVALATVLP